MLIQMVQGEYFIILFLYGYMITKSKQGLIKDCNQYTGYYVVYLKTSKEINPKDTCFDINVIKKKALNGDYEAQFTLGLIYLGGNGVKEDIDEAVRWLKKSANNGYWDAQSTIGKMYLDG